METVVEKFKDSAIKNRKKALEKELRRIIPILKKEYEPEKIILFGSLANGDIREWSDIDLVIVKKSKKRFIDRIGDVIDLCNPRVGIDFVVYTPREYSYLLKNEPFIQQEVQGRGEVVYEKKA